MRHRLKLCRPLGLGALGLLALTAGTWFAPGPARAQSVVMRLDPASQTVDVGSGKFTVDVVIDGVTNLGAYEFDVKFNPNVLRFVGVENGPFLGSTGRKVREVKSGVPCQTPVLVQSDPDGFDSLHCACGTNDLTEGEPAGPNGSGVLAIVTFAPAGAGVSALTLIASPEEKSDTGPSDILGDRILVDARSGTVSVVGVGPTATPEPDEPTAIPTEEYSPLVHSTPDPLGEGLLARDPGETPMAGAMSGSETTKPSGTSGTSGTSGGGVSAAGGSSRGSSAGSSAGGSPRAGSGPPEDEAARWPTFAGGLLAAAGAGLLAFSILLKHGRKLGDDKPEL